MEALRRPDAARRWINRDFVDAYARLHELGWAHWVEIYDDAGELVGGLYGVRIERLFAGESMFHRATDASKVALVHLVDWLRDAGGELLDVQWTTPHLASLGAIDISRDEYLNAARRCGQDQLTALEAAMSGCTRCRWAATHRHRDLPTAVPGAGGVPATEITTTPASVGHVTHRRRPDET